MAYAEKCCEHISKNGVRCDVRATAMVTFYNSIFVQCWEKRCTKHAWLKRERGHRFPLSSELERK